MTIKAEMINPGRLTPKQVEVALLMAEGLSDKDIARTLAISIKTVAAHTAGIYEKLGLRCLSINTRVTAIITLVANGMIRLSIKGLAMALIFNCAQLDNHMLRVRSGRGSGSHASSGRRATDA